MSTKTNLALFVNDNPLSRTIKDRGIPVPGPDELLVRVEAAGLNPVDARLGTVPPFILWPTLPTVIGAEASGIVEVVGKDAGFKVGDRVAFGTAGQKEDISSYQQYSLVNSHIATKLPSNISLEEGASIPVGLLTSYHSLYAKPPHGGGLVPALSSGGRNKYVGQPIVILGGAGATGHYALQLARISGFSRIITTASPKNEYYLKSLGATHVIDRSLPTEEIVKIVFDLAPTLYIVFDTISTSDTLTLGYEILKYAKKSDEGKRLLQIVPSPVPEAESQGIDVYMGWASSAFPQYNALSREVYAQLEGLLADGTIKPMKIEVVKGGLGALEEAFRTFDKVSGVKRVVLPQETSL